MNTARPRCAFRPWLSRLFWPSVLLCAAVAIRLVRISEPFVDWWSWRQADTATIAQNFYLHGFNIFYPQIRWAGSEPGYVGTEFPLIPFIAALLYTLFGVSEWIGRSISVLFFAVSVPFLYLLVKAVSNRRSALLAGAAYALAPLSIFASRVFMSDMASLSFSIAAVFLFSQWLQREDDKWLFIGAALATSVSILTKLPAIIIGVPLSHMAWVRYGGQLVRQPRLLRFTALALAPPVAWYAHAYLVSVSYPPYHMFGGDGLTIEEPAFYFSMLWQTLNVHLTPVLSFAALVGLCVRRASRYGRVFHWWLAAIALFALIAGFGNRHPWYQLPVVPAAAAFAGMGCDAVIRQCAKLVGLRLATLLVCLPFFGLLGVLSFVSVAPMYDAWRMPSLKAGREVDRIAPIGALIIVTDDGDPTALYYAQRNGWHLWRAAGSQADIAEIERLKRQGATYLVFTRNGFWLDDDNEFSSSVRSRYRPVRETEDFNIFDLTQAAEFTGRIR
jgi:hypothetical protein